MIEYNNPPIVEELRKTLLKDIQLQEKVLSLFKKIIRRLTIIFITMAISLCAGVGYIIYVVSKMDYANLQVRDINYNLILQKKIIDLNNSKIDSQKMYIDMNKAKIAAIDSVLKLRKLR